MRSDLAVFFFFLEQRLLLPIHCDLAWYILHNWRYYGRLLKLITQRARHGSGEKKKCIFRWYSSNLCWLNGSVLHICFPFLLSELLAPFTRWVPFQYSCTIHSVLFVLHASRFALAVSPQFPSYLVYYYSLHSSEEFAAFLNPPSPPEEARVRR